MAICSRVSRVPNRGFGSRAQRAVEVRPLPSSVCPPPPPPPPSSLTCGPRAFPVPCRAQLARGRVPLQLARGPAYFFRSFRRPHLPLRACFPRPEFIWSTPARRRGGPCRRPRSEPFAPNRLPRGATPRPLGRFQSPSRPPIRRPAGPSQPANHPLSSPRPRPLAGQVGRDARPARRGYGCGAVPARDVRHGVVSPLAPPRWHRRPPPRAGGAPGVRAASLSCLPR